MSICNGVKVKSILDYYPNEVIKPFDFYMCQSDIVKISNIL